MSRSVGEWLSDSGGQENPPLAEGVCAVDTCRATWQHPMLAAPGRARDACGPTAPLRSSSSAERLLNQHPARVGLPGAGFHLCHRQGGQPPAHPVLRALRQGCSLPVGNPV